MPISSLLTHLLLLPLNPKLTLSFPSSKIKTQNLDSPTVTATTTDCHHHESPPPRKGSLLNDAKSHTSTVTPILFSFFIFFGGRCGLHLGILVQFVKFALKNYDYFWSLSFWFLTFYSPEFRLKLYWGNLRNLTLWWLLLWLLLWLQLRLSLQLPFFLDFQGGSFGS